MSLEDDLRIEYGLTDKFEVTAEYTCPACGQRREVVFRDARAGQQLPCSCGGFAFTVSDDSFREVQRLMADFQKSLGSLGKLR